MALIPDGEAQDILDRLGAIENILAGMSKKTDVTAELAEVANEVQALRNEVGSLQIRSIELKARYESLGVRVDTLEA